VGNNGKAIKGTMKAIPLLFRRSKYTKSMYMDLLALLYRLMAKLLALLHDGAAGPLLIERRYTLTEQVRQLIMLSPAKLWTAQEI
ncbi:hypothetical protein MJM83_32950, partial [Salmonella enterica subsp. enterica serovar Montevideo]|nr:hypothetical protein [Salmonella enterica subsp. enterica serovar Montevideo]